MTETSEASSPAPRKRAGGLSGMLLADLKAMAGGMGIKGAGSMKKAQLIEAIKAAQASAPQAAPAAASEEPAVRTRRRRSEAPAEAAPATAAPEPAAAEQASAEQAPTEQAPRVRTRARGEKRADQKPADQGSDKGQGKGKGERNQQGNQQKQDQQKQDQQKQDRAKQGGNQQKQDDRQQSQNQQNQNQQNQNQNQQGQHDQGQQDDDADGEGRRSRRRRGRDRERGRRGEPDTTILDDDVLVPAAGILDVLDNYAFVRTTGYLPSPDDVYVSLSLVRKLGLRSGDAVVGQVRQPREGERKEKFNPMVRIDSVNGGDPETARHRVEFDKLTPTYADERLRMETTPTELVGRMIDLAAPVGKGQRGLVIAPPEAGRTVLLQRVAAAVTANNPECHLMVVLVDERPEDVTDYERDVKGEVIASTVDRAPGDHTALAELALERAKRLVELGHDVVVLLDGLTRLGRAYNLSSQSSGRILAGGVDATALHPPKRFFGAARNVDNGGSLTILATAAVETSSRTDEVVLEELTGAATLRLRLRGDLAERGLFPAIDLAGSRTRREELLVGEQEEAILAKLRASLAGSDPVAAHEELLAGLRGTQTNIEFLTKVQKRA